MKLPDSFPVTIKRGNCSVKIYQGNNKGYSEFRLAYYDKTGKRKYETYSDYSDASTAATRIVESIASGNIETLTLTNEDRLIYLRAIEALRPLNIPLDVAVRDFVEAKRLLGEESLATAAKGYLKTYQVQKIMTVEEVMNELIDEKENHPKRTASPQYLKDLRHRLKKFNEMYNCDIRNIGSDEIRLFLNSLNVTGRTWFNYARVVRTMFRFAQSRRYYPKDVDPFEGIDMDFEDDGDIEIFTPKEMIRLFEVARSEIVPFLAIGAFAGLRHQEICRLDWSEVLSTGYIEVKKGKAKVRSRRLVPISSNLSKCLTSFRQATGPVTPFENMSKQLLWLADATTSKPEDAPAEFKPFEVKWKHNALRHSFISYRLALTADENRVALEAGNSPAMIYRNYRQLVTKEQAEEWFAIVREQK